MEELVLRVKREFWEKVYNWMLRYRTPAWLRNNILKRYVHSIMARTCKKQNFTEKRWQERWHGRIEYFYAKECKECSHNCQSEFHAPIAI